MLPFWEAIPFRAPAVAWLRRTLGPAECRGSGAVERMRAGLAGLLAAPMLDAPAFKPNPLAPEAEAADRAFASSPSMMDDRLIAGD
jgi:hypothetical protein